MAHKLKTERVNAGVIAECTGEGCTWSGKHKYKKGVGERPNRTYVDAEDPVFPNRQLAVEAHRAFHSAKE